MRSQFEYLICQAQQGRITIVNGEYAGRFMGNQDVGEVRERMLESCPEFGAFFAKVGAEGWELVCAYNIENEHAQYEKLIFKRPK